MAPSSLTCQPHGAQSQESLRWIRGAAALHGKVTHTHATEAVILRAEACGVEAEDLARQTEPAGGIQYVGPLESYSGVPAVGNGKWSEDRFLAAAKRTKSEGGKATRKR
ncbi:Hypothetical predicted protein [Pelobates cultripes]|uniref:Uncharacterized protein n=1 Tax=Pelobates cultripes TaxID=61616 RepID=A0AAD1RPN4_PELCU|nr:Hypothetical predicted protein [Pelobates cultripes]